MPDPQPPPRHPTADLPLPPELERRLEILARQSGDAGEFDATSWFWLVLFGLVTPAALLLWGWWA